MSEPAPLDLTERKEAYLGIWEFPGGWILRVYCVTAADRETPSREVARETLGRMLEDIDARMSEEFEYARFGFVILHVGRRGICITVTHYGRWGATFEVYRSVWYRYGHDFGSFQLLDDIEPAVCWFEIPRSLTELQLIHSLAKDGAFQELRRAYMAASPGEPVSRHVG